MAAYNAALMLHIVGIVLMAGTSFIDLITFRAFCAQYAMDTAKGSVLEKYLHGLQRFLGTGMRLILISGPPATKTKRAAALKAGMPLHECSMGPG